MTRVIGLTGGIASGKSNVSNALKKAGVPVVDADQVSRSLTADGGEALPMLRDAFGDDVFAGDSLDRRRLAELVFSDGEALRRLNALMHPLILERIDRQLNELREQGVPAAVLDAPLLFEAGLEGRCDEVWCVWLPQKEQLRRLCARDGLTQALGLRRIRSQMPTLQKKRRADRVIDTRGTPGESAAQALALLKQAVSGENENE
ncbi:MAG: dephospho-CoA kinase [Clostridia bacterium]|nr:dephospho-CoA kinase [Clostridia bacterium]